MAVEKSTMATVRSEPQDLVKQTIVGTAGSSLRDSRKKSAPGVDTPIKSLMIYKERGGRFFYRSPSISLQDLMS